MSLNLFPSPQPFDTRTLRESNECLDEGLEDCVVIDECITYPSIVIKTNDIMRPSVTQESAENIFIARGSSLHRQVFGCWKQKGLNAALQLICDYDYEPEVRDKWWVIVLQKTAQFWLDVWTLLLAIYVFFYPYALKSNEELCGEFSKSMDWKNGLIRAFEWHPNSTKCALCLVNDSIYVYSSETSFVPLLRHSLQNKVTALSWNPTRDDILAVSCERAVLIWTVDVHSKQYRLRADCVKVITKGIPSPLSDIQYDSCGQYLVTCCPQSSKLVVIDTSKSPEEVKLVRDWRSLACLTKLLWSPDQCRLLCLTTSDHFRIYENKSWSSNKWRERLDDIYETAVWSRPNGHILLVSPRKSCAVFALFFYDKAQANDVGGSHVFHKVLDISEVEFPNGAKVGGSVHQMIWDKNSERLAISFKENRQYIALYKTVIKAKLEITPIGFVHGLRAEIPLLMSFHDAFRNGSLLTICWSSGVVSYIPLEFDKKSNQSMYINGTPRSLTSFCVSSPNRKTCDTSDGTPIRGTPFKERNDNSFIHLSVNDSVLSPKRPVLFSTLPKKTIGEQCAEQLID